MAATEKNLNYRVLSWTAYYDNTCATHKNDKKGSGQYPKKLKKQGKTRELNITIRDENLKKKEYEDMINKAGLQ